jgi:NAD(P)-dependent dehydrogenase (short-subunit alcohol dehydrogenase family)
VVASDIGLAAVQGVVASIVAASGGPRQSTGRHRRARWRAGRRVLARRRLDVVVNSAGIALTGSAEDATLAIGSARSA